MSSEAFEEFAENFGCWITDHGAEGAHGGRITGGSWPATIHLPTLESAIKDLITEARAMVAAETLVQLEIATSKISDMPSYWRVGVALEPVRAELAEIAAPDGQCASCGHISQPEYRHDTTDHVQAGDRVVPLYALRDLQRRMAAAELVLGLRT